MELGFETFLLVCPLLFLAGLVDAIGGGGGLISLPAYLLAGLPPHTAIATNKMSSTCGTAVAAFRLIRNRFVDFRLAAPSIAAGVAGSAAGARLSLLISEKIMMSLMVIILPVCAFLVLNKNLFRDRPSEKAVSRRRLYAVSIAAALIIGVYDGFYGPGTGTFLIIAFNIFAGMDVRKANGQTKIINLTTNVTSLVIFLVSGQVAVYLGLAAAVCNMLGGYIGAGMMMEKGTKIVRPSIILVLLLLLIKIISGLFSFG
ncbi:MAG: TSUP family transporter [Anaerovoracaceae bacterium]